jgi:hypothetical protein
MPWTTSSYATDASGMQSACSARLQYGAVYSTSIHECAHSHAYTCSWQQFGFWAASWLYLATDNEPYKRVCLCHARSGHFRQSRNTDAAQCSFESARQRPSGGSPCVGSHCMHIGWVRMQGCVH